MSQSILAIDTATEACSAALSLDGQMIARYQFAPRQHTRLILPMVEEILAEAGVTLSSLDAIAFARGPGAFTGLRIAAAVTQGLAYAVNLPVIPVSTLAAMAWAAWRERGERQVLCAIDARMQEVYWAAYQVDSGHLLPLVDEVVCAPQDVVIPDQGLWYGVGSGWATYGSQLHQRMGHRLTGWAGTALPEARYIAELALPMLASGAQVEAHLALPVYLRNQVARKASR